jgi:S-DNA-T family DNA segregation ATPase FtsK/SpoIIIE
MLFLSSIISKPRRVQGAYVAEKEVLKVTEFIAHNQSVSGIDELSQALEEALEKPMGEEGSGGVDFSGDDDPLYEEAKKIVMETKKASASYLQRRLRVGYARAARLLDILEDKGVVGPGQGAKARDVYGGTGDEEIEGGAATFNDDEDEKKDFGKDYNEID